MKSSIKHVIAILPTYQIIKEYKAFEPALSQTGLSIHDVMLWCVQAWSYYNFHMRNREEVLQDRYLVQFVCEQASDSPRLLPGMSSAAMDIATNIAVHMALEVNYILDMVIDVQTVVEVTFEGWKHDDIIIGVDYWPSRSPGR